VVRDMKQIKAKITQNKKVAEGFFKMRVESAYLAKNIKPGQFIEALVSGALDPLLRRPLGAHRILKKEIEVLYEVVGKGTAILSGKRTGEYLDVIGPLGNGFEIKDTNGKQAILIAGGIGVAPIVALAEELLRRKAKVHAIIGAKKRSHIMCDSELKSMGCSVSVATEDGSKGRKGFVTDLLRDILSTINYQPSTIYACGPNGMLEAIWRIAKDKGIPCQFSFESRMACGVGVCLGCPIKVRDGLIDFEYKMVCKDGPVFNAEEVFW